MCNLLFNMKNIVILAVLIVTIFIMHSSYANVWVVLKHNGEATLDGMSLETAEKYKKDVERLLTKTKKGGRCSFSSSSHPELSPFLLSITRKLADVRYMIHCENPQWNDNFTMADFLNNKDNIQAEVIKEMNNACPGPKCWESK